MQVSNQTIQKAQEAVETYSDEVVPMALQNLDDGRSCSVCGGSEYETNPGTAVCRVTEHTSECSCGGELFARGLRVEIEGHLPFGQTHVLDVSCSDCEDGSQSRGEVAVKQLEPDRTETFELKTDVLDEAHPIHQHHTSYVPERTILVCEECHGRIHSDPGFREDLTPDRTRSEWRATLNG